MRVESQTEILSPKLKAELIKDVVRNGGRVTDPEFKSLEEYLTRNPAEMIGKSDPEKQGEDNQ